MAASPRRLGTGAFLAPSVEATIFRRKWHAAVAPGNSLPAYEEKLAWLEAQEVAQPDEQRSRRLAVKAWNAKEGPFERSVGDKYATFNTFAIEGMAP